MSDTRKSVEIVPSMVDGGVSRVVGDGSTVWTETWDPNSRSWAKGGAALGELMAAPPASAERMDAFGIPESDRD